MKTLRHILSTLLVLTTFIAASSHGLELAALEAYEVEENDFVYAEVDGEKLWAHSYRPKGKQGKMAAVVEVHGGAWNLYDRMAGQLYNRALASSGLYVLAVDFRQGPRFQHPLGSRDVVAAVRYLKSHAPLLNIAPESIGIIGSSSGGHLAMLAGIKPGDGMHKGTPIVLNANNGDVSNGDTNNADVNGGEVHNAVLADDLDAAVNYVIALWPVSNPHYRFQYAKRVGREELVDYHLAYFGNEEAMRDANVIRAVKELEAIKPLPDLLLVQAGNDNNIPQEMTNELMAAWQDADGKVNYAFYPNEPHAFGHRPSEETSNLIQTMRDFIARQVQNLD